MRSGRALLDRRQQLGGRFDLGHGAVAGACQRLAQGRDARAFAR
jgi:hypothetical protein